MNIFMTHFMVIFVLMDIYSKPIFSDKNYSIKFIDVLKFSQLLFLLLMDQIELSMDLIIILFDFVYYHMEVENLNIHDDMQN